MAKTDTEIKTAPFESIRSGEVSVGVVSPPFEDIRANRDAVYGMRARSQPSVPERIRPVLEGTRTIDDYLPPAYVQVADAQPDPMMYRERTTAAMLLADDMKMDFDMIDRGFDSAVMSRFGEPLSAPQVVDRLSPYKRVPQLTAGNKDNWFVTNFEKYIREPITEATGLFHPYIGEYAYDPVTDKVYKRFGRGVFGMGILGEKPVFVPRAAAKRKGVKEAVGAGLSQAGIRGARSVAGTAEAAGELVRADKLAEWGRLMAEAADTYYVENPDEAMQLISGRGVVGTTYQFITRPEMILQGVVETVPMLLEAWLGHITGTKAAQVIGKGARVLPWAGRVAGMGTEIFGNEYHDARKAGTPPGPALAQAVLTSTIEGMIEEFTLSKKVQVFHGVAGQTAKKGMAKAATSLFLEYTKAYPRGFAEEGTQRMNSNFWRMVFTDKQSLAEDFTQRLTEGAAEDAAVGGIIEMALTGGFIAAGKTWNLVTDEEKLNRVKNLRNFVRKDPNITAADKKEMNDVFDNVKNDILGGKYQQGPATQAFREKVRASEAIKGDDQKTDVVMALTQARANAQGKTTEQFIEDTFVTDAKTVDVEGEALFQEAEPGPVFYSKLKNIVETSMPETMDAKQFKNWIVKQGVKKEELAISGIEELQTDGKVTKQQVLDLLVENAIEVETVVKGDLITEPEALEEKRIKLDEELRGLRRQLIDSDLANTEQLENKIRKLEADIEIIEISLQSGVRRPIPVEGEAKFEQYVLPGGENYRELLLRLPLTSKAAENVEVVKEGDVWRIKIIGDPGRDFLADLSDYSSRKEAEKAVDQLLLDRARSGENIAFASPHFNEFNILAHVRMDDRVDAEGDKVLFIEEIQSDWHQQGRVKGYRSPTADESARFEELTQLLDEMANNRDPVTNRIVNEEEWHRLAREREEISGRNIKEWQKVPDAPFKRTWHELAFKRMLRYAAENGYQKIAWTTGAQQVERYDLSKQIDKLRYTKIGEEYSIQAIKGESAILNKNAVARDLPSLVGKDVADRIVAGEGTRLADSNYFELTGDDLKIGGEGMRGFYDRILPNFVNKYAKKWGVRVEDTEVKASGIKGMEYVGPTYDVGDVLQLFDVSNTSGRDIFENPVTGKTQEFAINRVVVTRQLSGVMEDMTDGTSFEDSMAIRSEMLAELFGGELQSKFAEVPVHSLDITPEMAESVLAGQTLFQAAESPDAGYTVPQRRKRVRAVEDAIVDNEVYQNILEGVEAKTAEIDVGLYFVPDDLRSEVEDITGKPKAKSRHFWTSLQKMFTFDTADKATHWEKAVQSALYIETPEGEYDTSGVLDISEFVGRVKEALESKKTAGQLNIVALQKAAESSEPDMLILIEQLEGLKQGLTLEEINRTITEEWIKNSDITADDLDTILVKELDDAIGRQTEEQKRETALDRRKEAAGQQRKKAAVEFAEDGKAIITAFKAADFSSMVHELGHVFRRTLDVELLTAAEKWAGVTDGVWTTKAEEKFARAFERYLWEGKAPTQKLRSIFAKLREWLRQIYQSVRGTSIDINLSPAVKETFDKMFTGPAEIHPGEMTKAEFINMAISHLEKRGGSVWIEKYLLATRETPTQAHRRLKAEWQAQQAGKSAKVRPSEKGVADLTAIQKQQIDRLEAEVVSEDIIQSVKDQPIAELLSRGDSDFFVIADFRQKLVAAFAAGKKTTIETVQRQYKEIYQRSRARKQLREYIQKLARQIAKPAPTTVDLFYREAIAILQLGIDPSFRAKRTLADRQATRKFLEKYPDRELPRKLIDIINKKALNEYTIAELEQLAKERKRLQELGKKKKALRLQAEAKKLDEIQGAIVDNIRGQAKPVKQKRLKLAEVDAQDIRVVEVGIEKGEKQYDVFYLDEKLNEGAWELDEGKTVEDLKDAAKKWLEFGNEDAIAASTTRKPLFKTGYRAARAKTLRPSRIFDMFDGGKATFDGIMHRSFYDAANRATDAELRVQDARSQSGDAKLKELGLTLRDLASTRIVAGVEYSVQEMMGIYGFGMNFKSRLAVQFGNKISKRAMAEITHHVEVEDPRLAELTNWIIAEFEDNFTRLEDAFIDDQERRLIKEESYLPMRRKELDYTPDKRDLLDDLKASLSIKRAQTKKGFTLERADIPAEFQKPIQLDLWSLWLQQVKWQEHYIHHAKLTRDLHRIAGSEEFRSSVKDVFGEAYVKTTTNWISRVANPYVYKSFGYWNNASRKLRNNAAMSYLAFNLVTIAKQLPSLLYYLADAGPVYLAASAAEFAANPLKMINRVRDLDPQVRHPALERTLEELKIQNRQLHDGIIKKVGKAGMQGIYWMDAVARTIGWNAVYRRALESHKTLEPQLAVAEAIRLAQDATLRTQPAAAPKDLSEMYVSNEALNWFLMFSNQLNQIYQITTYDTAGYWKNKQYAKAGLAMTGLVAAGAMIWAATNRKLPDEPEEFVDMLIDTPINMIPLIGREIQTARRGFGGGGIGAVEETAEIFTNIEKGKYGKALESIAVLSGVPTVGPKRVIKAVAEEDITELIGGPPRK